LHNYKASHINARRGRSIRRSSPSDPLGERRYISDERVTLERKTLEGSARRFLTARAARVGNDHRNKAKVNGVSHGGLDANLEGNASDRDRFDSAVT
jgi:hypothetical protein